MSAFINNETMDFGGASGLALTEVAHGARTTATFTLMPLRAGQHPISAVRVVDHASKRSYTAESPVVAVLYTFASFIYRGSTCSACSRSGATGAPCGATRNGC